jgi:hypothetical protein
MKLFARYKIAMLRLLVFLAAVLLFGACNPTRYVPEGNYLLNRVSVKVDDKNIKHEEIKTHVRQK